jgi:hypothetical protein
VGGQRVEDTWRFGGYCRLIEVRVGTETRVSRRRRCGPPGVLRLLLLLNKARRALAVVIASSSRVRGVTQPCKGGYSGGGGW